MGRHLYDTGVWTHTRSRSPTLKCLWTRSGRESTRHAVCAVLANRLQVAHLGSFVDLFAPHAAHTAHVVQQKRKDRPGHGLLRLDGVILLRLVGEYASRCGVHASSF